MDNDIHLEKSERIRSEFNTEKDKMDIVITELHLSFARLQEIYKKCSELVAKL